MIDIVDLMEKHGDGYEPRADFFTDMADGKFKLVGELFAYSICMIGPSPYFLCPWIYLYITCGIEAIFKNNIQLPTQSSHFAIFDKVLLFVCVCCFNIYNSPRPICHLKPHPKVRDNF